MDDAEWRETSRGEGRRADACHSSVTFFSPSTGFGRRATSDDQSRFVIVVERHVVVVVTGFLGEGLGHSTDTSRVVTWCLSGVRDRHNDTRAGASSIDDVVRSPRAVRGRSRDSPARVRRGRVASRRVRARDGLSRI